ncbi:MAG: PspA/IM30 family protein [Planctomycetota bacterium]|nr:PspA/IM30 family protein [Planctomycetota bacterium]
MGIFKRISDIVSANFTDLVEEYEDPEKMLKQAIREMEEAIGKAKPDVVRTMANEKTAAKELASNEAQVAAWAQRAEKAVEAGDDDLARKAITRKQEYEKVVAALRDQHEAMAEASQTLRRQLEGMQAKLKDAQRRLGTLTARQKAAQVRAKAAQTQVGVTPELDQDAFDKFDRMARKVEMAEAEAEALTELARSERAGAATNESLGEPVAEDLDTEAELLELKRKAQRGKA